MRHRVSWFLAATLAGGMFLAQAQPPRYWPYAFDPGQAAPPSWYYNPYTSGLGPCPQRYRTDPPCRETIQPSYGQPDYWGR